MAPRKDLGLALSLAALVVWSSTSGCGTGDNGNFDNKGGTASTDTASGAAPSTSGGANGAGNSTANGGVVVGTVNPDAGTFEPVTTVEDPEAPYETNCDNCPSTEPLRVKCSSGCCCAHYCEGQFGSLTDKPCCDEQGGVIGLNCTAQ